MSQPVAIQTANLCFCLTNPCGPHAYLCTSLFKDPVGDMSARSSDSALDPGRLQGQMPSRATPLAFNCTLADAHGLFVCCFMDRAAVQPVQSSGRI